MRLVSVMLLSCAFSISAQETATDSAGWSIGPIGQIYPDYMGDPRRPQTSVGVLMAPGSELSNYFVSGTVRTVLSLGGRVPVVRYTMANGQAWELAVEGAFFGQFDAAHSLENIGWDGWFGFNIAWRFATSWSTKLHYRHLSSHLGDEFLERTGRERIGYTREDLTVGLAWKALPGGDVYAEFGGQIHTNAERQENLFIQFGAQYRDAQPILWDRLLWQVAVDAQLFEEDSYYPGLTVRGALVLPTDRPGNEFRVALEFHTGRVLIGELSEFKETYLALILAWDF
jgi:hypothetical protein